jgi:hypothetical protein
MVAQCLQFTPSMSRTQTERLTEAGQRRQPSRRARKRQTTVFKEIIMNAKQIVAAVSIAFAASAALATEATQFVDPVSTLTPAGVAAVQAAKTVAPTATIVSSQEATQFADVAAAARQRDEVRAEARSAGRAHSFNTLYVGS